MFEKLVLTLSFSPLLRPSETLPVDSWFLSSVPHVNMSTLRHPPSAEPAEVSGPWSHAGGLPH